MQQASDTGTIHDVCLNRHFCSPASTALALTHRALKHWCLTVAYQLLGGAFVRIDIEIETETENK